MPTISDLIDRVRIELLAGRDEEFEEKIMVLVEEHMSGNEQDVSKGQQQILKEIENEKRARNNIGLLLGDGQ